MRWKEKTKCKMASFKSSLFQRFAVFTCIDLVAVLVCVYCQFLSYVFTGAYK